MSFPQVNHYVHKHFPASTNVTVTLNFENHTDGGESCTNKTVALAGKKVTNHVTICSDLKLALTLHRQFNE